MFVLPDIFFYIRFFIFYFVYWPISKGAIHKIVNRIYDAVRLEQVDSGDHAKEYNNRVNEFFEDVVVHPTLKFC